MSKYNGRDYLSIIWKDPDSGARIEIGKLSKNGCYEFIYDEIGIEKAKLKGFEPLVAFPDYKKIYTNEEVFPAFSSRLPDKRRKDINEILKEYGLSGYDSFELLRKSGGKLPTDSLEFVDPIFYDSKEDIKREFFIAGTRYRDLCDFDSYPECRLNFELQEGEDLKVIREEDNTYDSNAVLLLRKSAKHEKIGYVPAYYAEAVSSAISNGQNVTCRVKEFNKLTCQECVKVVLFIKGIID